MITAVETTTIVGDAGSAFTSLAEDQVSLSAGRVTSLHRHLFADCSLDRHEAASLFDLERTALTRSDAWTAFFVQAVTDHVVWGARPTGRLSEDQAEWLIARVDETRTPASFAILVNVLDETRHVPAWFEGAVRARAIAGWPGLSRGEDAFSTPLLVAA